MRALTPPDPPSCRSPDYIESTYQYNTTVCTDDGNGKVTAMPKSVEYQFRTARKVPKVGLMLVGWGGNNGSTTTAGILANKMSMSWPTKEGTQKANYYGSLTQASTCRLGAHGPQMDVLVRPVHGRAHLLLGLHSS